ncbi:hypothetical protein [Salipaludibacillus aurantiacus]|uniref:Lipoprotein n=1 Tax=Salipaludibacillus aurantiacus TaxID=1601833 RepID=A0A1H9T8Z3_9BACI|nr:hypothetical protein [Salipaludibacillus aurantiacus]SER93715.1 hypothetical protein SAMN05518684_105190 [Salipaludibacillus aurantiacus]
MKQFIVCFFVLVLTGCQTEPFFHSENMKEPSYENTTIEKAPFILSFKSISHNQNDSQLLFVAEHTDKTQISESDYQFLFPEFIADSEDIKYEIKNAEITHDQINGEPLDSHQMGITLGITSPPANPDNAFFHIPLYIVPRLFEHGYPFKLESSHINMAKMGDLRLMNVKVEDRSLSFDLIDEHPGYNEENFSYLFTKTLSNEVVHPMFTRVDTNEAGYNVELEFAQPISLPSLISIERTTVDLPKWRFSFVIPMENDR